MYKLFSYNPDCEAAYAGKSILITGSVGTVGSEVIRQIIEYDPCEIRLFDNNESGLFLQMQAHGRSTKIVPVLGDVRDAGKLQDAMEGVNTVFHLAAYKHVCLCEYNPFDAVRTNVIGTQNVLKAAIGANVERVLYTSSDKAVNPTNVMGTSKLLGERVVTAANLHAWNARRGIFSSTRFGNVLGSSGSVIPVFNEQIKRGGPVTVTDFRMTRFIMTVQESARLLIKGGTLVRGGEVLVMKMPVIRIADLAEVMIDLLAPLYEYSAGDIAIEFIGPRPGEKLYEELMTEEEMHRAFEMSDMFLIRPAQEEDHSRFQGAFQNAVSARVDRPYISKHEKPMTRNEIIRFLLDNHVLGEDVTSHYTHEYPQVIAAPKTEYSLCEH